MSVDKKSIYSTVAATWKGDGRLPTGSFEEAMGELDRQATIENPGVSRSSLANCHGSWYEWMLGAVAWNEFVDNESSLYRILPLPNVSAFNVAELYVRELAGMLEDLKGSLQKFEVSLTTSNPDFVIIRPEASGSRVFPIDSSQIDDISRMEKGYEEFKGKCELDDIVGFLSVKYSLRPDRRLQIPHEGSLWKALYSHLRTRLWIVQPHGLRYYAASKAFTDADKKALKTAATHTLVSVNESPEAAVDTSFVINSVKEAQEAVRNMAAK